MEHGLIKVACDVKDHLPLDAVVPFQGELKSLLKEDYERLKKEIIETGFAYPLFIWKNSDKFYLLGGHQRVRTLKTMRSEGWTIPNIPVVFVFAETYRLAKRRVLQDASEYGTVERQGLYQLMTEIEMDPKEFAESFKFPDLNLPSFDAEYFKNQISQDAPHTPIMPNPIPPAKEVPAEVMSSSTNAPPPPYAPPVTPQVETLEVELLKPHPRNYRKYPPDYLQHIMENIKEAGVQRNVVISPDNTILSGHGTVEAAKKSGLKVVPIKRFDCDPLSTKALKVLLADNELDHLSEKDDRRLSEILKDIKEKDPSGLAGTGYDEKMLANLLFVTRPASEIQDINEAEHWVGLPEYEEKIIPFKLIIALEQESRINELLALIGVSTISSKQGKTWSINWPEKERQDLNSIKFVETPSEVQTDVQSPS